MNKRIYIAGPMTGKPGYNIPAFNAAAERLRSEGHFVINPAELSALFGTPEELSDSFASMYGEMGGGYNVSPRLARVVMDADLAAVRSCDAIFLLNGWENSKGALKELHVAIEHKLQIIQEKTI